MFNLDKFKSMDPKARITMVIMVVLSLVAVVIIGMYTLPGMFDSNSKSSQRIDNTGGAGGGADDGNLTPDQKAKLREDQKKTAEQAAKSGKTDINQPIDGSKAIDGQPKPTDVGSQECNQEYLTRSREAGVTANELKCLGCSPEQMKAAGFTAADLEKAKYGANELLNNGQFTFSDLREAGFSASDLKKLNANPKQLLASGYSVADLIRAKYSPKQLRDNGIPASELLQDGVPIKDLVAAGYTPAELAAAGITPEQMARNGMTRAKLAASGLYTPEQLNDIMSQSNEQTCSIAQAKAGLDASKTVAEMVAQGCSAKALKAAGYTDAQIFDAKGSDGQSLFTPKQLYAGGIKPDLTSTTLDPAALKAAGYSAADLAAAGFTPEQLKKAGFSAAQMRAAGYGADELKRLNYDNGDIVAAGYSPKELKDANIPASDILASGQYSPAQLLKSGAYSLKDLNGQVSPSKLRAAGFTPKQLLDAGFSPSAVESAGYASGALRRAGLQAASGSEPTGTDEPAQPHHTLLQEGCTDVALNQAISEGKPVSFMKSMGCSAKQLIDKQISPSDLAKNGYGALALEQAGLSPDDLKAAGFSDEDIAKANSVRNMGVCTIEGIEALKGQNVSINDLKTEGCNAEQLNQAGYSAADLAKAGFSVGQLKQAGYSNQALADAGFSEQAITAASKQVNEDCSPAGLQHHLINGTSAVTLRHLGCTADQLVAAKFSPDDLEKAGFSLQDLVNAGESADALIKAGFSPQAVSSAEAKRIMCTNDQAKEWMNMGFKAGYLRAKHCTVKQLRDLNMSLADIASGRYTVAEMIAGGVAPSTLIQLGYNQKDVANAVNASLTCTVDGVRLMHDIRLTPNQVSARGCNLDTMRLAGYTAQEMFNDKISADSLIKEGGYSRADLIAGGYSAADIPQDLGCTLNVAKQLFAEKQTVSFAKSQGCSPLLLIEANYPPRQLNGPFTLNELIEAKVPRYYLLQAGFTDAQINAAMGSGVCTSEMIRQAIKKGTSIASLKQKPCSAALMHDAEVPLSQLIGVYDVKDLIELGKYTARDFFLANYRDIKTLRLYFTVDQLTRAGYSIEDVRKAIGGEPAEPDDPVAKMRKEQEKMLNEQERASRISMKADAMMGATMDMMEKWAPNASVQNLNVGASPDRKKAADGTPLAAGEAGQIQKDGPHIKAASTMFASLDSAINSDSQEPVVATIVAGPLQGAKILGQFTRNDARLALNFNTISIPCANTSQAVNVSAISVNNARNTVVNRHALERYGSIMAAAFIDGAGNAIKSSGSTVSKTNNADGSVTVTTSYDKSVAEAKNAVRIGLGNVGDKLLDVVTPLANKQPTVTMREGGVFGLLFMSDFELPKCVQ